MNGDFVLTSKDFDQEFDESSLIEPDPQTELLSNFKQASVRLNLSLTLKSEVKNEDGTTSKFEQTFNTTLVSMYTDLESLRTKLEFNLTTPEYLKFIECTYSKPFHGVWHEQTIKIGNTVEITKLGKLIYQELVEFSNDTARMKVLFSGR